MNWPFFGPDATWHLPFLSFVTPPVVVAFAALAAGVAGHLMNLPLASLHGPDANAGDEAVSNAIDASAKVILRMSSPFRTSRRFGKGIIDRIETKRQCHSMRLTKHSFSAFSCFFAGNVAASALHLPRGVFASAAAIAALAS